MENLMSVAPEYVVARRVLLDALSALEDHRDNLVLVGAQAVYLHTGDADLNVPLLTTDADLAVNTRKLADVPEIGGALRAAGFRPGPNPGHWVNTGDGPAPDGQPAISRPDRRVRVDRVIPTAPPRQLASPQPLVWATPAGSHRGARQERSASGLRQRPSLSHL
jgi:hypothetical protein